MSDAALDGTSQPLGFSGIGALISTIDVIDLAAQSDRAFNASLAVASRAPKSDGAPATIWRDRHTKKWLFGAAIGVLSVGAIVNIAIRKHVPNGRSPAHYSGVNATTVSSTLTTVIRPKVGTNLVLNAGEIRYCLEENARIDGESLAFDVRQKDQVDSFNEVVTDFNSRCGSFRYREAEFDAVKADVAERTKELAAQGRDRLATSAR